MYKRQLQSSYGVNSLALVNGKPKLMNIKEFIHHFIEFRKEIIRNRTRHDLGKARDRAHVLIGLAVAVANVDQIIEIIKSSKDPNEARTSLLKTKWLSKDIDDLLKLVDDPRQIKNEKEIYLTDEQAKAILELRLQRLTALGKDEIKSELSDLSNQINKFLSILRDTEVLNDVINVELNEIKKQFAIPRRTEINAVSYTHLTLPTILSV